MLSEIHHIIAAVPTPSRSTSSNDKTNEEQARLDGLRVLFDYMANEEKPNGNVLAVDRFIDELTTPERQKSNQENWPSGSSISTDDSSDELFGRNHIMKSIPRHSAVSIATSFPSPESDSDVFSQGSFEGTLKSDIEDAGISMATTDPKDVDFIKTQLASQLTEIEQLKAEIAELDKFEQLAIQQAQHDGQALAPCDGDVIIDVPTDTDRGSDDYGSNYVGDVSSVMVFDDSSESEEGATVIHDYCCACYF
jgi:hypothetical protein